MALLRTCTPTAIRAITPNRILLRVWAVGHIPAENLTSQQRHCWYFEAGWKPTKKCGIKFLMVLISGIGAISLQALFRRKIDRILKAKRAAIRPGSRADGLFFAFLFCELPAGVINGIVLVTLSFYNQLGNRYNGISLPD